MKPVMYRYLRPRAEGLPHFPYLALADFQRQLDQFASTYGFVGRPAFVNSVGGEPSPDEVLLTFDDGLRDHRDFVLPVLRERGLFGLFYVQEHQHPGVRVERSLGRTCSVKRVKLAWLRGAHMR